MQALNGLAFLHERGIIHRDIKCGNILIDSDGLVMITDFGVSAILQSHDERRHTVAGTWNWMAPEVLDSSKYKGYDTKADIWSVGITVIEMAYGVPPYTSLRNEHEVILSILNQPPPTLVDPKINTKENKQFSANIREFVKLCLQKAPNKRPTAPQLMRHKFLKIAKDSAFLKESFLQELPKGGERYRKVKETTKKDLLKDIPKEEKDLNKSQPDEKPKETKEKKIKVKLMKNQKKTKKIIKMSLKRV